MISILRHEIAQWLLDIVDWLLSAVGLHDKTYAQETLYVILVMIITLGISYSLRKLVLFITQRLPVFSKNRWVEHIKKLGTLESCSKFIAPAVFLGLVPFAFTYESLTLYIIQKIAIIYLIITLAIAVCAILKLEWVIFNEIKNTKNLPLEGILNMCRGIVWLIAVILIVSVLINESPFSLLAGIGALSAVLLLIFKDSILGLVATIQLSSNDMIRKGDWIVVDGTSVNGNVLDVTLSSVKVKNWDNTTAILSPYKLISGSFVNWRGMFDTGARRIESCIYIDPCSVSPSTAELFSAISKKYPIMLKQIEEASAAGGLALTKAPQQSGMATNLGLYRAYMFTYLRAHPRIAQNEWLLVNLQPEVEFGIPVRIYCYSNVTSWVEYVQISDEVIEHFFSVTKDFELDLCNYNSFTNKIIAANSAPTSIKSTNAPSTSFLANS
ncbi:MAG: mechanosensitive ion channel family protein [Desulfovibrio sp.]|uniref:mechanosensitive ion channel family protein n=1 Tax=Desulfovibrio sp. TaxID=885 RepID=UPI001A6D2527|nr:mechanosensitive ion channel family protein [Desulfovibrio sp.]MBD5416938.1 mechanosensitive ion channel family protein [Desulfovibrio sp.]